MNNKELASAIVKALENNDNVALYGIALELLKDESDENTFTDGAKYVLAELADLYDGITDTDVYAEFMNGDNN